MLPRVGLRALVLSAVVCLTLASAPPTRTDRLARRIGSMKLLFSGVTAAVDPLNPVVPKNTPAGVRIVITAGGDELDVTRAEAFLGGPFEIQGELSGPGLTGPTTLASETSSFLLPLPALNVSGDYALSNLRVLVDSRAVLDVSPQEVPVRVIEQVLITSVKTRALTLDELKDKGVVFDGDDVVGFEFTLAMTLESKPVNISFPVAFDRQGVTLPQPLLPPPQPARTAAGIDLPSFPTIVPLMLEPVDDTAFPEIELPGGGKEEIRIPSVLVIPGDVGFLKQFFSAQLFVANGTPGGSGLIVRDVSASLKLPPGPDAVAGTADDPLALPELTTGLQSETLPVLGVGADGEPGTTDDTASLAPGEQGQAEFLIRGESEGFHTLELDIDATLDGLVTGPVQVRGHAKGGVLVRNPFLDVTFTVPAVVRAQEPFKLYVNVRNIGDGLASRIDVSFNDLGLSGLKIQDGAAASQRIDTTLRKGDSATVVFDFEALRTGKVVATYLRFDSAAAADGTVNFTLGVGERNVPLSPDTLVLPAAVDALPVDLVNAALRVLGQAWSVANAPAGTLPPGVTRIRKNVVVEKALALAEGGLRIELGESPASAVRGLVFDFTGGTTRDAGFDELLRTTNAGAGLTGALATALTPAIADAGGLLPYERETARLAASGDDFITFAVETAGVAAPGATLFQQPDGVLGIVTDPKASPYELTLSPKGAGTTSLSLTLPRGDGTFVRGTTSFDFSLGAQGRLVADLFRPESLAVELDTDGDGLFETLVPLVLETLAAEGPRLVSATVIGPELLDGASSFGFHAAALFDRVVDEATASDVARYTLPGNAVRGAVAQLSGRLVFLTLERPEGPYVPATLDVEGIRDSRGVSGPPGRVSLVSRLADDGAVVTGRVFEANGTPVSSGAVGYANYRAASNCSAGEEVLFTQVPVDPDGRYALHYVRRDPCGSPFRILFTDVDTGELRSVSGSVRAPGERIVLDLALFGRGAVTGVVTENGQPAPGATVSVTSGTDEQSGGVTTTDGDGRYTVFDVVVGPVSVKAARGTTVGASSGRVARSGTTATVDVALDPGRARITGTVSKRENGVTSRLPGVQVVYRIASAANHFVAVAVAKTDASGAYVLEDLPHGRFQIEAILDAGTRSRLEATSAPGDDLVRDIIIPIASEGELGTLQGTVRLPDGTGVEGAQVRVGTRGVLTGAGGAFTLPGVAVKPGQVQVVLVLGPRGLRSGRANVVVSQPGQLVGNLVITLSGLGSATFTVKDPSGNAVPNQLVGLLGNCANLCGCASGTTDALGEVTFANLAPGTHFAKAVFVGADFVDVGLGSARVDGDGAVGRGLVQLEGIGTVTGTVLLPGGVDPAAGADVTLISKIFNRDACELRTGSSHRGRTDAAGRFRFTGVNFGRVSVTARHPFANTVVGATSNLTKETPVDFTVELVDTTAGVLSGTVFLPDGVTPAGAGVELTALGPLPEITVRTDDAGRYAFAPIFPQGLTTLTVADPVTGLVAREKLFLRAGEDVGHDFRLKGRGTVRVRVADAAGAAVSNAFVRVTESEFPGRVFEAIVEPPDGGVATFEAVTEGPFNVEAKDVFGRDGGRVPSVLPAPGATLELEVRLNAVGIVEGHFRMPDTTPIAFGVVKLLSGGRVIGQTTTAGAGDVGAFRFDFVPVGPLRLEAQDPLTARQGFTTGELPGQDQTLVLDVLARGLGRVEGTVTANGIAQPSAHVDLVSGTFRACATADTTGFYFLEGVPEGVVAVTASLGNGFLSGTNEDVLLGDANTLRLDVALRDSVTLKGTVTKAGTSEPAPPSLVSVRVGGAGGGTQSTTSNLVDGTFRFERVPAGLATIDVAVLGGLDKARRVIDLLPGQTTDVPVPLNGVGSLRVRALDSGGLPTAGKLTLRGTGSFPYAFTVALTADGVVVLPEVLAGPVSAALETTGLFGTASGLVRPGEELDLPVRIEDSGIVRGVALLGGAPAVGAEVEVELSGNRGTIATQTNVDGAFEVRGIPLGVFDIRVTDRFTGGVGAMTGLELVANGDIVDGLVIDLDASPVRVTRVEPPEGSVGVPVNQVVRVHFSDPVAALNGAVSVVGVSSAAILAPDGLSASLATNLPDARELTLQVSTGLVDVFGRHPVSVFTSTFRTVDLSPPKAVATAPADDAFDVDGATSVLVTFDEPLADTTDFSALVSLAGVSGLSERVSATEARFTPASPLDTNRIYAIVVDGAIDVLGNRQSSPLTVARFATRDDVAPALSMFRPAAGGWVGALRPVLELAVSDNASGLDGPSATFELDGALVGATLTTDRLVHRTATDLAEGPHTLGATIADRAGNVGGFSGAFQVDVTAPAPAALTSPAAGAVLAGTVHFSATATDALSGLARIDLRNNGSFFASLFPPSFAADVATSALPEGAAFLTARALDVAGNIGPEGAGIPVRIDNRPLRVTFQQPAAGARLRDAVTVRVSPSESVTRVDFAVEGVVATDDTPPYLVTLDLTGVSEGIQPITATAFGINGDVVSASRDIVVDRTPPLPPSPELVFAEPPQAGASLVHGLPGAVEPGAVVDAANLATAGATVTTASADGSFALSLVASIGDTVALTATDDLSNRSGPTQTIVRSLPSLPPPQSATRLRFDGLLVDRLGETAFTPDSALDAVFSVELDVGDTVSRDVALIDLIRLEGSTLKSTRVGAVGILGVTAAPGGPFLNALDTGTVSLSVRGRASLTLFSTDFGFIQEGSTYTVKIAFTDGSEFVAATTLSPPSDLRGVPHSLRISASPSTVVVPPGGTATTTLTIDTLRDIEGTPVPDGVRIALSVADMASVDPYDHPVRSAGGEILDGVPAKNDPSFRVFTVAGGMVAAQFSTGILVPVPVLGALVVVQALAADDTGNVLGNETIGTLDLNVRSGADRASVFAGGTSLYGDKTPRRVPFRVTIRDVFGVPVVDGTRVLLTARRLSGRVGSTFIPTFGGNILGSPFTDPAAKYQLFLTSGGEVAAEYELPSGPLDFADPGEVDFATVQIVLSRPDVASPIDQRALGTASIAITGAAGAEIDVTPASLPLVFPERQLQIRVRHVHDARGNLVPDDAKIIVSARRCTTRGKTGSGLCPPADGGAIIDGTPSGSLRVFSLANGAVNATYEPRGILVSTVGQTRTAGFHVAMADVNGLRLTQKEVAYRGVPLLTPLHAVGTADPPTLLADGHLRSSTVVFTSIRDAYGNPIPDGARVGISAFPNRYRRNGVAIPSVFGAQILNGEPASTTYRVFTVQNGIVSVNLGIDNVTSAAGALQTANVMILPLRAGDFVLGNEVLGVVPVSLPGITSATALARPTQLQADGTDRRAVVTFSDIRDALGNPVPDGTRLGLSTGFCATRVGGVCVNPTAFPAILGSEETLFTREMFTVRGGQIVAEISTAGITVPSGSRTAIVQAAVVKPAGGTVSPNEAVATAAIELVPASSDRVAVSPVDVFADGTDRLAQVSVTLGSFMDGDEVALTVDDCAAEDVGATCIPSIGGTILGTSASDPRYRLFTVTGGGVQTAYSAAGLALGVGETGIARISALPTDGAGNVTSATALATGEVRLRGATSASASGAATLPRTGGEAPITFSGIRDAIGNTVPDGTTVLVSVSGAGGTLLGGSAYTVLGGTFSVTYSTTGASPGIARIEIFPARNDGTPILTAGGQSPLLGGVHEVTITP